VVLYSGGPGTVTASRLAATVMVPPHREVRGGERINWRWVATSWAIGAALLSAAFALEGELVTPVLLLTNPGDDLVEGATLCLQLWAGWDSLAEMNLWRGADGWKVKTYVAPEDRLT
jgi:hypothetical protein